MSIQFEAPKLGTLANPRVKWADRGVIGIWRATINLIEDSELPSSSNWVRANFTPADGELIYIPAIESSLIKLTGDGSGIPSLMQYISSTPAAAGGTTKFVENNTKSIQFMIYKGTADVVTFDLYDVTSSAHRLTGTVTFSTTTVACTVGTLYDSSWFGTDCVIVECVTTVVTAANDHYLQFYLPNNATTTIYISKIQAENATYPAAYVPVDKIADSLFYRYSWAQIGAIEIWAKPAFPYNVGTDKYIISDGETATCHISIFYKALDDKYHAVIYDGATTVDLASTALISNVQLQVWTYLKIYWNNTANSWGFLVRSSILDDDKTSTTALTTIPFSSYMEIGGLHKYTTPAGWWNGWITDLMIWPTADTSDAHYVVDRPWYDTNEITNSERSVRISQRGIAIHNGPFVLTDKYNRYIEISNSQGLLARDASGKIIHDLPNALIMLKQKYLGHCSFYDDDSYIIFYDETTSPGIANINITSLIGNSTNVKGVILSIEIAIGCLCNANDQALLFGLSTNSKYNDSTHKSPLVWYEREFSDHGVAYSYEGMVYQVICPVFWVAGSCYLSLYFSKQIGAGNPEGYLRIFLQGALY